jgi:hypothetical protein
MKTIKTNEGHLRYNHWSDLKQCTKVNMRTAVKWPFCTNDGLHYHTYSLTECLLCCSQELYKCSKIWCVQNPKEALELSASDRFKLKVLTDEKDEFILFFTMPSVPGPI